LLSFPSACGIAVESETQAKATTSNPLHCNGISCGQGLKAERDTVAWISGRLALKQNNLGAVVGAISQLDKLCGLGVRK